MRYVDGLVATQVPVMLGAHLSSEFVVNETRHCDCDGLVHKPCLCNDAIESHWRHLECTFVVGGPVRRVESDRSNLELARI